MLVLPGFLNWFSADIAYHHLHHLSIAIPNHKLAVCHRDLEPLFAGVKRVRLHEVLATFNYQLWDKDAEKVVARDFVPPKKEPVETPSA
jgi:omega-6 fatty acid desaturase (delta-12 desaturase)